MKYILLDINECLSNPCSTNALCSNINGSFSCQCIVGYSGNGFVCQGVIFMFLRADYMGRVDLVLARFQPGKR